MDVTDCLHWKAQYETGHDRIDFEHRVFLNIIRCIDAEVRGNADRNRILRLLNELRAYARFHFISEENVMLDCCYPGVLGHAELHGRLLETLDSCIRGFEVEHGSADRLIAFLVDWFVDHTTTEDMKIVCFIAG